MIRLFILITLFPMALLNDLSGQIDPYVGFFSNDESALSLSVEKLPNSTFQGKFIFQGHEYPYQEAFRLLGILNASYEYNGNLVPFSLSISEGEYYLNSEGVTIAMKKLSEDSGYKSAFSQTPKIEQPIKNVSTDVPLATGLRYKDPYGTYTFQAPAGWTVKQDANQTSLSKSGVELAIGIAGHNYENVEAVRNDAQNVSDPSSDTYLKSTISAYGNTGLMVRYDGTSSGEKVVIEALSLISPYGGGVVIAYSGKMGSYTLELSTALKTIANSIQFTKATLSANAQQWMSKLKGKQLLYLYTGSGYSEKTTFDLCFNGSFVAAGDNSYSSSGFNSNASGATASGGEGNWKIISSGASTVLVLYYSGGGVKEFTLTPRDAGNEVGMNGERYFIQESEACQ